MARRDQAWDYAQANDAEIMQADPRIEEVREAVRLLDRDPESAFSQLVEFAQQGSVWAMIHVGWCRHAGCGTLADQIDSERWYRRAHEAGSDRALLDYALMLRRRGASDLEADVYAAGVARDWAPALCSYAQLRISQADTRKQRLIQKALLHRAADFGSPRAQFLLARHMLRGMFGLRYVPEGIRRAYRLIRLRLAQMDAEDENRAEALSRPAGVTLH
ncbi:MAG: hypothetical protein ACOY5Y_15355 [Pseudomonadota bacterium]